MTARIYVYRRPDGKVYSDTVKELTDRGYKLQANERGIIEAIPADQWCVCPECNGTGSRAMLDDRGMYIKCVSCNGMGVH